MPTSIEYGDCVSMEQDSIFEIYFSRVVESPKTCVLGDGVLESIGQ